MSEHKIRCAWRMRLQGFAWRAVAHHLRKAAYASRARERRPEINAQRRERKYRAWLRAEETMRKL